MPFTRLIATAVVTISVVGPGVARADAPWSAPVTIASGDYAFWQPALAFTNDGHALAVLNGSGAIGPRDIWPGPTRILAAEPGATAFAEVGSTRLVAGPAAYGRRGAAYLRTPPPTSARAKFARLGASLGTVPDSLGRFQQLARVDISQSGAISARIAADPRGNVAAVWLEPRPRRRASADPPRLLVRVALRRPGHAFGRATTIGDAIEYSEGGNLLDVAYGANGDLVVTFQRTRSKAVSQRTLELAVRVKRHGRAFGAIQSLGPSLGSSSIGTAVTPTGAAVVAWGTQDGGEGVEEPWTVRAAVLRSTARRFSKTQLLDRGLTARPVGPVSAAIGRDGTATVAWSGMSVAKRELTYPVLVATALPGRRFSASMQLAPNGAARGVVTARDGATTVLLGVLTDPEGEVVDGILASRRPAGATLFTAPEAVSQDETAVNHAAIALNPQSGQPAALWIGAPGSPPGQPLDGVALEPRYSTRGG
jgi:hypothetical protein